MAEPPDTALSFLLMLGDRWSQAKSVRVTCQPCFGCGALSIRLLRPVQRPLRGGLAVEIPELAGCCTARAPAGPPPPLRISSVSAGCAIENASCGRGADQVARAADLVGAVVERAEAAGARARHRQAQPDSIGTSCSVISAPCPGGFGPDVLADARPGGGRRRSTSHRAPDPASTGPRPLPMSLAMSPAITAPCEKPTMHVAGQRAAVVHVGDGLDRGAGALGAAVVVGHLLVGRERIVELRRVRNGVLRQPVGAELPREAGWSRSAAARSGTAPG